MKRPEESSPMTHHQRHYTDTSGASYKGIPIYAEPGTHEAIFEIFSASVPRGRVLELGAGAGAFSRRLADSGYDVLSSDIDGENYRGGADFKAADLNTRFSETFTGESFAAVIALEVLEHLENPLHFLREVARLLDGGNSLWVSFPNIYLFSAIQHFVRSGEFVHWSRHQYWDTGHQTILTDWLFRAHCEKCGLAVKRQFYCNPIALHRAYPGFVKRALGWSLMTAATAVSGISAEARRAESVLFEVVRKNA